MDFRILGPLEVWDGDRLVELGSSKQRAVLAILLLNANQVVSSDRLIDDLWGGSPPKTATTALQVYVSDLRKALAPDTRETPIITRAPGYVIELESKQLDLSSFEKLLQQAGEARDAGDIAEAAQKLGRALDLWHGPPLADFAYEPFAQTAIARLEELRLTALEDQIDAKLELGGHRELVSELETIVSEHPLRERPRGQLMLALYRSGRQAEALTAYQDARGVLVEELGIEPSPVLRELESAILRQDPSLEPPTAGDVGLEKPAETAETAIPSADRAILIAPRVEEALEALLALAEPLAKRPLRELIVARLVGPDQDLTATTASVLHSRDGLIARGMSARAAAFTSTAPGEDLVRLASEQQVDLLLLDGSDQFLKDGIPGPELADVLEGAPCDVGILLGTAAPDLSGDRPVFVPFGGAEHDWAAAQLGAWIARPQGLSLRLIGTEGDPEGGKRDASRLLASASLMVQQLAGVPAEPVLVSPGSGPVIKTVADAALLVMGLSARWREEGLGATRLAVAQEARPPRLLVRKGIRPGGLAPRETMTRFTWTLAEERA